MLRGKQRKCQGRETWTVLDSVINHFETAVLEGSSIAPGAPSLNRGPWLACEWAIMNVEPRRALRLTLASPDM